MNDNDYDAFLKEHRIQEISMTYQTEFHCSQCGECCRHVAHSIQMDSIDAYRIAQFLRKECGKRYTMEMVYSEFAEPILLEVLPVFMLKSKGVQDECVFLDGGKCSIHSANPHICHLYPFDVVPNFGANNLLYSICREKQHHFKGQVVSAETWMRKNLRVEDREFLIAQNKTLRSLVPLISILNTIDEAHQDETLSALLYYLYYNFDVEQPFLPQYWQNHHVLTRQLILIASC